MIVNQDDLTLITVRIGTILVRILRAYGSDDYDLSLEASDRHRVWYSFKSSAVDSFAP